MQDFKRVIVIALIALFASPGVTFSGEYNMVMNIGDAMPAFENLPATDGGTLSASDLDESVVVLVSLANHCPWVKGMDAGLVQLVDQFKGKDVRVVGFAVNHREDDRLPAMKEHAAKNGYNFTYVFDESQELGRQLRGNSRNGQLIYTSAAKNGCRVLPKQHSNQVFLLRDLPFQQGNELPGIFILRFDLADFNL